MAHGADGAGGARRVLQLCVVALAAVAVHANSLDVPFLYDDAINILENPSVRDPSLLFGRASVLTARLVGYASFALNYRLHGLDVRGYHALNLLVHAASSMLVAALAAATLATPRMRRDGPWAQAPGAATAAGLLFAVHPASTQAVAYVVQRFASMAAMWYLASVVLYAHSRMRPKGSRGAWAVYAASLGAALLAAKTKETAATLPLAVAVYECLFFKGRAAGRAALVAPFLAVAALIPIAHLAAGGAEGAGGILRADYGSIARGDYLLAQPRVALTYLRLFLFPVNQSFEYGYPIAGAAVPILILAAILGAVLYLIRRAGKGGGEARWAAAAFGGLWFFIALSVESTVVPLRDVIAEQRMYLPLCGACLTASVTGAMAYERLRWSRMSRVWMLAGFGVLMAAFATATIARNAVWADEVRLWEDAARKAPLRAETRYGLGRAYQMAGAIERAAIEYEEAIRLEPTFAHAHNNLGAAYARLGRMDLAASHYGEAIRLRPSLYEARLNMAMVHLGRGELKEARRELEVVLDLSPGNPEAIRFISHIDTRLTEGGLHREQ